MKSRRKAVDCIIFHRALPHYRGAILDRLNNYFKIIWVHSNSLIEGLSGTSKNTFSHCVRSIEIDLPKKIGLTGESLVLMDVLSPLRQFRPKVVIAQFELSLLSIWLLFIMRRLNGYKFILWGHGFSRRHGFNPNCLSDKLRLKWIEWSDGVILYNNNIKYEIKPYCKTPEKLFVANNTLDTIELIKLREEYEKVGIKKIKNKLHIDIKYNIVFVGRLIEEKEPTFLLEVFTILLKLISNVQLHIVGRGPLEQKLKSQSTVCGINENVTFWGEILDSNKLGMILYVSDLMVNPGCVGLSIVHALCFDCPIVTQQEGENGPFHGTEIEYLKNGETGFFTPPRDKGAMAKIIYEFLLDKRCKKSMKRNIRGFIEKSCSIEKMMQGFKDALRYVGLEA